MQQIYRLTNTQVVMNTRTHSLGCQKIAPKHKRTPMAPSITLSERSSSRLAELLLLCQPELIEPQAELTDHARVAAARKAFIRTDAM